MLIETWHIILINSCLNDHTGKRGKNLISKSLKTLSLWGLGFFIAAERRKLELAEKYKELQKSGKVDAYLGKKRKKTAQKEKKKLPVQVP